MHFLQFVVLWWFDWPEHLCALSCCVSVLQQFLTLKLLGFTRVKG